MTRRGDATSPWLAWLALCGLLSGLTLGQLPGGHLPAPWWGWALTPPALLAAALLTGRRRGSRLLTAGVMLAFGWAGGLLLHLIITLGLRVMLRVATG
ncbi:hypothetical protein [Deinococcus kurensis]|uniref:hypothetical protein n=1 Tax=Deinococcus kurensis TaxID=2662757 RepID=UPI0012D322D2|nr:hypothetical protein [Deinococcus kurensis]